MIIDKTTLASTVLDGGDEGEKEEKSGDSPSEEKSGDSPSEGGA